MSINSRTFPVSRFDGVFFSQEVSEAYEVLSDETKRSEYDRFGTSAQQQQQNQQQGSQWGGQRPGSRGRAQWQYQSNVDPEELFRTIFGDFRNFQQGQQGQRGRGGFGFGTIFDDFSQFGFGRAQETVVNLTFREAAKGANKEIDVVEASGSSRSVKCHKLQSILQFIIDSICRSPRVEKKRYTVPIPAGIEDGQTLRLSIGGNQEIFVTVRVEDSSYFTREGPHVHTNADISISQAVLGGIIRIQGLYEDLNVRIPAGTGSHSILTLADRGFSQIDGYGGAKGNHYVHLKVKVPTYLTEEQKEIIREFAYLEKDTPGTVSGVDKFGARPRRSRPSSEPKKETQPESEPEPQAREEQKAEEKDEGFFSKLKKKIFG